MKIKIEIDCDTVAELQGHLNKIKEDVRNKCKKAGINTLTDPLPKSMKLDDANCYGEHYVTISN